MPLPPGHGQAIATRPRLSPRERRMIGGVLVVFAAVVVVLVVSLTKSGPASGHGCIYATIPAATGAQDVSRCGAAARATCATVFARGAFTAQAAPVVAAQCRKAGLHVGR